MTIGSMNATGSINATGSMNAMQQKDEIDALLDEAFEPKRAKLMLDRAIFEEYYRGELDMTKFALKKQVSRRQFEHLFEKYNLQTKKPRKIDPSKTIGYE